MTSLDKSGVTVAACASQAQSQRKSAARVGISKVGRSQTEAAFISPDHTRTARLCRETKAGPVYELGSTLGGCSTRFASRPLDLTGGSAGGRSPERIPSQMTEDPDSRPSNDALKDVHPDSQPFKYRRDPKIIIGTAPRGKLKDAELIKNHTAAFYARDSPGPAAVGGKYGPAVGPTKPAPTGGRFGIKTTNQTWMSCGDNPPNVGPGTHERRDVSIGQQHLTRRRNQSVHGFTRQAKFPKDSYQDSVSVLDAARSCVGKQVLSKNRSAPSINFSADNRDGRSKAMICRTKEDVGPKAHLPKFTASMPRLPMERTIMEAGIG